ncbi:hypothetical protein J2X45_002210 [Caulobacter sp. BE264]|uniref:hypothetical protein n=1 Tax=Caulobacter sp. BE264 TaxID=2817724 RepID=UPI002866A7CF|nr:hypothetical protein [Caulobacter sp. BE264]MDR7231115.1 hypothetical protein [Caulobacter sp. BE264]
MIRLLVIAITALMATTAANAGEITVKVRGRATPVVHAEIVDAARQLCKEDLAGNPQASDLTPFCIREVTRDAVVRANNAELRAYNKGQGRTAYLRLATR